MAIVVSFLTGVLGIFALVVGRLAIVGLGVVILFTIVGGVIARSRGDYFIRGAAISLVTGVLGIFALVVGPASKARDGDERDEHNWPPYGGVAALVIAILVLLDIVV